MATIDADAVCDALGVRAVADARPLVGGMSGSALWEARSASGVPVIVKATGLADLAEAGRAQRELHVYTEIAAHVPLPAPRLVGAHVASDWIALAIERHCDAGPAPSWDQERWVELALLLGRSHRAARDIEAVPPTVEPPTPHAEQALLHVAENLWSGPGDAARLGRVLDEVGELRATIDEDPRSFVHGDSHLGNVVRTAAGELLLVDWQSARRGSSSGDIAFALTWAAAAADQIPRRQVIDAYSAAADVHPGRTRRAITAHQLLTLVEQYPEFSSFLGPMEVGRLRRTFDALLSEWAGHG